MIRTVGVLCTFLFFLSCKKGTLNNCTDDTYAYEFFTASKIDTLTNPGGIFYDIKSGSNIVFQIPAALNSFQFENNKLADVLTLFKKLCFCPTNASAVTSGSIKGTRISSSKWDIQINIELPGTSQKIEVTRIFLLK